MYLESSHLPQSDPERVKREIEEIIVIKQTNDDWKIESNERIFNSTLCHWKIEMLRYHFYNFEILHELCCWAHNHVEWVHVYCFSWKEFVKSNVNSFFIATSFYSNYNCTNMHHFLQWFGNHRVINYLMKYFDWKQHNSTYWTRSYGIRLNSGNISKL